MSVIDSTCCAIASRFSSGLPAWKGRLRPQQQSRLPVFQRPLVNLAIGNILYQPESGDRLAVGIELHGTGFVNMANSAIGADDSIFDIMRSRLPLRLVRAGIVFTVILVKLLQDTLPAALRRQ